MYKIPAKTLFLGKNLIFMPECHSTNDLAQQLSQRPNWIDGTLIITDKQTAGRGQRGNSWLTEPGKNLTFSMLLKPGLAVKEQFSLTLFVSLGIRDYVTQRLHKKVHVKWPNDIVLADKKLGGILIENQIAGMNLSASVIGIGLNINQQNFELSTATSLALATTQKFDLAEELETLLLCLEKRYFQMKDRKFDVLMSDYLDSLYRRNELHFYSTGGNTIQGKIIGVDETGRLRVETDNIVKTFDNKEIQYVMN